MLKQAKFYRRLTSFSSSLEIYDVLSLVFLILGQIIFLKLGNRFELNISLMDDGSI